MTKAKKVEQKYQDLRAELEDVMVKLQNEELDVDEALHLYNRGLELVRQLQNYLKEAENTVRELKVKFDKGSE